MSGNRRASAARAAAARQWGGSRFAAPAGRPSQASPTCYKAVWLHRLPARLLGEGDTVTVAAYPTHLAACKAAIAPGS